VIDSEQDDDGAISSDTSDEDAWYPNFSPASSDSSFADSFIGEEGAILYKNDKSLL